MGEKIYRREDYLRRIRAFYKSDLIKVITGVRRSGKSFLLKSIREELIEGGVDPADIIFIELDKRGYKWIKQPEELERVIDDKLRLSGGGAFKYLFLDEIENVKDYEPVVNSFREEGNISIFITGSNSYLLSGELMTKLTGRYVEFELMTLSFYEYIDMKSFLGKKTDSDIYIEFERYIRGGAFPGALSFENDEDRYTYTASVIKQIIEKDIRKNRKIRDYDLFNAVLHFVVGNFGSLISVGGICKYLKKSKTANPDRRTISRYIQILTDAKLLYPCELFDLKSKKTLKSEKKYYLSDLSIYFALNTDNRINYGPVLENILFGYLKSKSYSLSVGRIGSLECDFIARKGFDEYFYIQVSRSIADDSTEEREYRPFYEIRNMYPKYLFTLDTVPQRRDGVLHENLARFMSDNRDLTPTFVQCTSKSGR